MAIDTAEDRHSMMHFGVPGSLPLPDGAWSKEDRAIGLGWYSGLAASSGPSPITHPGLEWTLFCRLMHWILRDVR